MLPEWMSGTEAPPRAFEATRARKKSFISSTLGGILGFFEETVTSEGYSRRDGLLQSLDPRVKLVSIVALIIAVSFTGNLGILLIVYLLILLFAYASRIGVWYFIKRVWLFIPIFAGIIALPMLFNIFMPGDSILTLATFGKGAHLGPIALPETLDITRQGLIGACVFTLRVATCVSAAVLLFLTTPIDSLFKSLRSIGVPRVYVLTLNMSYRYIFLFMGLVKDFYTAKRSRTIRDLPLGEEQKWVGGRIAYTLVKSLDTGEKVHQAMISRGYNGDVKLLHDFRMRRRDYTALATVLLFSVLLVLISQNIIII